MEEKMKIKNFDFIGVYLSKEDVYRLNLLKRASGTTRSALIRVVLHTYFSDYSNKLQEARIAITQNYSSNWAKKRNSLIEQGKINLIDVEFNDFLESVKIDLSILRLTKQDEDYILNHIIK